MWMHAGQGADLREYFSQVKAAMRELLISIDKFCEQMNDHLQQVSVGMKSILN